MKVLYNLHFRRKDEININHPFHYSIVKIKPYILKNIDISRHYFLESLLTLCCKNNHVLRQLIPIINIKII